ncbi:hypothetical protein [Pseudomonas sp. XK-1]|uniref:hypothetical protein n=1 Tax=Pseudomonas sp. XK-1 TaxID=3136019 RepID=UPI00311A36B0
MAILQILLIIAAIISGMTTVILQIAAFTKREDKGFWGGYNILTGWFLLFPYGEGGLPKTESALVLWCRLTAVSSFVFGYLAVLCRT